MKKLIIALTIVVFTSCTQTVENTDSPTQTADGEKIQQIVKTLSEQETVTNVQNESFVETIVQIDIDGNPLLGDENSPVTIIEFSDFQCPVCERYFREVGKDIKEKYVKTGIVKLVHMDYPIYNIHEYALSSAKAAECAYLQGKFWEMHDYLFEHPYSWQTADVKNILTNAAVELSLDENSFLTCFDADNTLEKIGNDYYTGKKLGVNGTPTFFINGKMVEGYRSFEQMSSLIDAELK